MNKHNHTVYECEICWKEFDSEEECKEHEDAHIQSFCRSTNKEVSDALFILANSIRDSVIGKNCFGWHRESIDDLLKEAARRLRKNE